MSENSVGASGLMPDDGEPSMEDILSSIRRIIAEDKSDENTALNVQETAEAFDAPPQPPQPESVSTQADVIAADIDDLKPDIDTNMDSEPADMEELIIDEPEDVVQAPAEVSSEDDDILDLVSYADEEASVEPTLDAQLNAGLDLAFETDLDGGFETISAAEQEAPEPLTLDVQDVVEPREPVRDADADDDIDLVKSLLADLMEEQDGELELEIPEPEKVQITPDTGAASADPVLDDLLAATIEDEIAQARPAIEAAAQEAVEFEPAQQVEDFVDETEAESDLARIAREAREASMSAMPSTENAHADTAFDEMSDDDVVSLSASSLTDKLALGGAGIAAAAALAAGDDEDEESAPEMTADAENTIEDEQENGRVETGLEKGHEESEEMVKLVKADTLVDTDTAAEAGGAFASLSAEVKKKADLEESGPQIGDLVQQALKPMLKEWLDANLKSIVERAVTKEVKRISSGK